MGVSRNAAGGDATYFDRNGDGVADLMVTGTAPETTYQWESDENGFLDSEVTLFAGSAPEWRARRVISQPGSRIFLDDKAGTLKAIPISEPGHVGTVRFVEGGLGQKLE